MPGVWPGGGRTGFRSANSTKEKAPDGRIGELAWNFYEVNFFPRILRFEICNLAILPHLEKRMNDLALIDYKDQHVLKVLKHTVARGATDAEFALFVEYCKSTKLNPFKKEIWFIKVGDRVQLMTGINGYWSIANNHPAFDGVEGGMIDKDGNWIKSVAGDNFIGAWCRVYRKDRKYPMEGEAMMADYDTGVGLWKHKPRIMIKKVAESIALRKAFAQELNGLYTQEEMPATYAPKYEPVELHKVDEKTGEVIETKFAESVEEDDIPWTTNKK